MFKFTMFILALAISTSQARQWETVKIPDAYCADGTNYKVFFSKKDDRKLAIEFMGGGVCWSLSTCYGPNLRTWIHPIPKVQNFSTLTKEDSFLKDHTMVYFPYCTGDVYAGTHQAKYTGVKVKHYGHINVVKAIEHLTNNSFISKELVEDLVLYGSSAGAISSFIHARNMDKVFKNTNKKTILADSPGLHFGKDFWEKFTKKQIEDFKKSFYPIGLKTDFKNGFLAPFLPNVCKFYKDWNIGILQADQDVVMSVVFGKISPSNHKKLIYSPFGLNNITKRTSNCTHWINESKMHTFLILEKSSSLESHFGRTAYEFVEDIYLKN